MSDPHRIALSKKLQIRIPKEFLDLYQWEVGQSLTITPCGRGLLISGPFTWKDLFGALKGADPTGYRDRGGE